MSLTPWKPLKLSFDLEEQIENAFAQFDQQWGRLAPKSTWDPDIDFYETDDAYLIEADLPGVLPQDVQIRVDENWLTISGSRRSTTLHQSAQGVSLERRHGRFSRRFHLNHPVDASQIDNRREDGIYYIRLPKQKRAGRS